MTARSAPTSSISRTRSWPARPPTRPTRISTGAIATAKSKSTGSTGPHPTGARCKARSAAGFGEAADEDRFPALAGEVEAAGLGVVGDAVEDVVAIVGLRALIGVHLPPQQPEIGDAVDAARGWIDPQDVTRGEHVAVELAVDQFELVETKDIALAGGAQLDRLLDREAGGIGVVDRGAAVAEDQVGAVIGEAPALARICHLALELARKVVDEDLVFLPGELKDFVLEDGQALAEHGNALIRQRRDLPGERNDVEPRGIADPPGALVELAVAEFEPLGKPDPAARDLADR